MAVVFVFALVMTGVGWAAIGAGSGSPKDLVRADPTTRQGAAYRPSLVPVVPEWTSFGGTPVPMPIPSTGQSAVMVQGVGFLGATPDEKPVPMASVTKVMTAVIVLQDHPLGHGSGPTFTMTAADNSAYVFAATHDDSNLEVVPGERLNERQLLEALMIPSADNIADFLARWDAGSIPAFVKKMNAMARKLGLTGTTYADASGVDPASQSTAIDQAMLGAYAMDVPGMISVEDHPTMTFPVEGTVVNYNPVVGQDGVIGLKSGFTSAAQGCLVTAARRPVGGRSVLVVSSTLGQPFNLPEEGNIDLQLLNAASSVLEARPLLDTGQTVAKVVAGWSRAAGTAVVVGDPVEVVGWPGLAVKTIVRPAVPAVPGSMGGWRRGTAVAAVEVWAPGGLDALAFASLNHYLSLAPRGWTPPARGVVSAAAAPRFSASANSVSASQG
jgi:D-alanyl-D-alanine carboxypeptidase (penicillin-binding protein 5/6)